MLGDEDLRVFLWRLIVEDCRVFQEDFPTNASAYSLLAKQEIGKRILADAKLRNPEAVFRAEQEYNDLMARDRKVKEEKASETLEGEYNDY
jgi:hypothetical protein